MISSYSFLLWKGTFTPSHKRESCEFGFTAYLNAICCKNMLGRKK